MNAQEQQRRKNFYIVDFDRTLADSDKLLEVFIQVADQYLTIPREQIESAYADVKARGDSFDTASYVRDHLADQGMGDRWEALEKQFIHESRSLDMLLTGAAEFLQKLEDDGEEYGILTYGNPLWQHLKIAAAGFNHVHRIVMEYKEKGRLVSSWRQEDGSFELPQEFGGGVSERIVMLDDKAVSFAEFPPAPSIGYWVINLAVALPSQLGDTPQNVTQVNTLTDAYNHMQ